MGNFEKKKQQQQQNIDIFYNVSIQRKGPEIVERRNSDSICFRLNSPHEDKKKKKKISVVCIGLSRVKSEKENDYFRKYKSKRSESCTS